MERMFINRFALLCFFTGIQMPIMIGTGLLVIKW